MAKNLQTHTCLEGCIHRNQAHFLQTFCDVYVQICVQSDIYGLKMSVGAVEEIWTRGWRRAEMLLFIVVC